MKKKTIELTEAEIKALKVILYAAMEKYFDRVQHAGSHGEVFSVDAMDRICDVIDKLENAKG